MSEVCEAKALQRVVVATDLTPAAAMATSRAAQLAADTGAPVERLDLARPANRSLSIRVATRCWSASGG